MVGCVKHVNSIIRTILGNTFYTNKCKLSAQSDLAAGKAKLNWALR